MKMTPAELDLMASTVAEQWEKLQAQKQADVLMLGAALHIIKDELPTNDYRRFVDERLPFGMQVARKIIRDGIDYLNKQLAADAAAAAVAGEGN